MDCPVPFKTNTQSEEITYGNLPQAASFVNYFITNCLGSLAMFELVMQGQIYKPN